MTPKLNVKNLIGHITSLHALNPILVPFTNNTAIGIAMPYINKLFPFKYSILSGPYA